MNAIDKLKSIQVILGFKGEDVDGKFFAESEKALKTLKDEAARESGAQTHETPQTGSSGDAAHQVKASSFADPADIRAFRRCKEKGGSDQDCFRVGDNGIGCYNDDVSEGTGPACALPPEDSEEKWGSVAAAKHKLVEVTAGGKSVTCVLKDRMPHRANIKNGAGIDLNPDAVRLLGMEPPIMVTASWRWI